MLPAPSTSAIMPSGAPSTTAEADIVVAAAVARLTTDNSFGGSDVFDSVSIVDRYGSPTADGFLEVGSDSPVIGADVRAALEHALAPAAVTWVGSLADVIGSGQDLPTYEEVGAVFTTSSPIIDGGHATITTGVWCGGTCGAGGSYVVEWTESQGWLVIDTVGPQWMA